jgi:hypothetical protein
MKYHGILYFDIKKNVLYMPHILISKILARYIINFKINLLYLIS